MLAPDILIQVPLGNEIIDEAEDFQVAMTQSQARVLNSLGDNHRQVVTGPAGSGKTVVALEFAKRRVAKGERVLFVCFNRGLNLHLRETYKPTRATTS